MVFAQDVKKLALVPVRGIVFVVNFPFVLVWGVLCWIFTLICIPACYAKKKTYGLFGRVAVTWNWTKGSAKTLLPSSSSNSSIGTQILGCNVEKRFDSDDDLLDAELLAERRPSTRVGRRRRKKAIVSALIRVLLEPTSPQESEDESAEKLEGEERVYQLIRDLIQFSKSGVHSPTPRDVHCPVLDFEALKKNAQDKEKLLNFISELDQYVTDMDSQGHTKGGPTHRYARDIEARNSDERQGGQEVWNELQVTPEPFSGYSLGTYEGEMEQQVFQDEDDDDDDEDEAQFDDAHMNLPYVDSVMPPYRGLSPVVEVSSELASSELASADSVESIRSCQDLKTELDVAMSRLSSISNELTEAVLETRQTKVTETVTVGTYFEPARKLLSEGADSPYEDACDEFPDIPKSPPTLGIQAGHDRRDVASVRKPRPPSLSRRCQRIEGIVQLSSSEESCNESDGDQSSQVSSDEEGGDSDNGADATRSELEGLSHSLSDQFKLLAPTSLQHHASSHTALSAEHQQHHPHQQLNSSSISVSDLYSTVNKEFKRSSRAHSEGNETAVIPCASIHRVQSSSLSELENMEVARSQAVECKKTSEKSLFIQDCTPPWKQMRSRSSSAGYDSREATPSRSPFHSHTVFHTASASFGTSSDMSCDTPPPIPFRTGAMSSPASQSQSPLRIREKRSMASSVSPQATESVNNGPDLYSMQFYDKLTKALPPPPIPSKAGLEGVYDSIPFKQNQRKYLHERVVVREKQSDSPTTLSHPPSSWTPELPPRNVPIMRRTISVDAMGEAGRDHDKGRLSRCGGNKHHSTSSQDLHRECSRSSRRHRSSSGESDHDRRKRREHTSSSDHHHHHRHHHGEHASSKHRSSSERHSLSDKKSSSKPQEGMSGLLKILISPSSAKSKTSSRSRKELVNKKEEKVKKDGKKDRKHSSSSKRKDKDMTKEETKIPRNESGSSLKSGTIMTSIGSNSSSSDRE